MPTIAIGVPETYMSVTRPVALGIARSIADMTAMSINRIMYNGHLQNDIELGSTVGDGNDRANTVRTNSTNRLDVSIRETYNENHYINTPVHQVDALSLFLDLNLGVNVRPIYSQMDVTITFTYRAEDYRTAQAWLDDIRVRAAQNRWENMHDVAFQYPMPLEFMAILKAIYELREAQAGYGETWEEWLQKYMSHKATNISKMDGTSKLLVFNEIAEGILGWFDFGIPPENEKGQSGSTREISFEYRYQYEKPIQMSMTYPLTVHNQMLDLKWIGPESFTRQGYFVGAKSIQNGNLDNFRRQYMFYDYMLFGIRIPHFDEWYPFRTSLSTCTLASILVQVNPDAPTEVLDLNDLLPFDVRQEMLDYFQKYHTDVTLPKQNPFLIEVFEGNSLIFHDKVVLDENLILRTLEPMNLRKTYHVHIGMLFDPSLLHSTAVEKLRNEPAVCLEYLNEIDPSLAQRNLLPKVLGDRVISKKGLRDAVLGMRRRTPVEVSHAKRITPQVANFLLIPEKRHGFI